MQGRNSKEQVQNEEQGTNPEVRWPSLDSPVRPIRSHACEVWTRGTGATGLQQVEQVHRTFLRGIYRGSIKQQALLLCQVSLEGFQGSISGGNKLSMTRSLVPG
jgi:hypothetical protein